MTKKQILERIIENLQGEIQDLFDMQDGSRKDGMITAFEISIAIVEDEITVLEALDEMKGEEQ